MRVVYRAVITDVSSEGEVNYPTAVLYMYS